MLVRRCMFGALCGTEDVLRMVSHGFRSVLRNPIRQEMKR